MLTETHTQKRSGHLLAHVHGVSAEDKQRRGVPTPGHVPHRYVANVFIFFLYQLIQVVRKQGRGPTPLSKNIKCYF